MKIQLNEIQFSHIISILQDNLITFRNDKSHIFKCVKMFSENNCCFLNEQYFLNLFTLDENYLKREFNWDDDIYLINMIVFQEYIYFKTNNIQMKIPKFFIQHFYFFEEKYQLLFDRNISKYMTDSLNMEIETNDINLNIEKVKNFSINEIDLILSNIILNENDEKITKNIGLIYRIIGKRLANKDSILTDEIIEVIRKIIYLIEFQVYLENEDEDIKYIKIINEKILNKLNEENKILDEEFIYNLLSKSQIDSKKIIYFHFIHPEKEQIYPDSNRKFKIFPFTFPIQIKILNLQNLNSNAKIYLMQNLKITLTLSDKNNPIKKDISILPSNGTIFSQIENKISIKKRENIFLESDFYHNKIDECLLTIEILSSTKILIEIRKIPFFILH